MTEEGRRQRIQEALDALRDQDPSQQERLSLSWRRREEFFPVIRLDLDVVLLNANSHRLKSQLESHPERELIRSDPWSRSAQDIVADLLRKAHSDFDRLKASLSTSQFYEPAGRVSGLAS